MTVLSGLLRAADDTRTGSLSYRLRAKRFEQFAKYAAHSPTPTTILDVGGTEDYWEQRGWAGRDDIHITLLNLTATPVRHANLESVAGDATDLSQYPDDAFHVTFSNSVIEHVGSLERQHRMAREMRRVGIRYWVQTPNYWFPMEPHYLIPGWQWLPERARVAILRRHGVGQLGRCPDIEDARRVVRGTRLLTRRELQRMFPDGALMAEHFGPFVKSWTMQS